MKVASAILGIISLFWLEIRVVAFVIPDHTERMWFWIIEAAGIICYCLSDDEK